MPLPMGENRVLSVVIYVAMGWLPMVALKPLLGVCYSITLLFFVL